MISKLIIKFIILLVAGSISGCSLQSALIISEIDQTEQITKDTAIYLEEPTELTIYNKHKAKILREVLILDGFNVVNSSADARYILRMKIINISSDVQLSGLSYETTDTTGYVGSTPVNIQSSTLKPTSKTIVVPSKNAVLELITITEGGSMNQIWQGTIAMHGKKFDKYFRDALEKLLAVYGTSYKNQVFVP